MFSDVDTSVINEMAIKLGLIILAIAVVGYIYYSIKDKILTMLGFNQSKEEATSSTKKSSKKTRSTKNMNGDLKYVARGLLLLGGMYLFFTYKLDWPYFFVFIFTAGILPDLLIRPKIKTNSNSDQEKTNKTSTTRKSKKKLTNQELLTTPIEEMSGTDFERLVALYYAEKGYDPEIIGGSGDHEVDLILTDPKEKYKIAVQCKHWKTKNVGNDTILRLSAGKRIHKCIDAWCITTSNYTAAAKEAAEGSNIRIFNGLHVKDKIETWQKKQAKQKTS